MKTPGSGALRRRLAQLLTGSLLTCVGNAFAQDRPAEPGPLSNEALFRGIGLRYPSDWKLEEKSSSLTIAPLSSFQTRANGKPFITHGFFLWVSATSSEKVHDSTLRVLTELQKQNPNLKADVTNVTDTGNPIWKSCGSTFDSNPPYSGSETGSYCTIKVGDHLVGMLSFSPSDEWNKYASLFDSIVGTLQVSKTSARPLSRTPFPAPSTPECVLGHWIQSISSNGEIIKLEDGTLWKVDSVDTVTTSIWLPVSNVVICGSNMISDGEAVTVTSLRSPGATTSTERNQYRVQASANDSTFVINNKIFEAKTYCFNIDEGDRVVFVEGRPDGSSMSASFYDLRSDKVCKVWSK